MLSLSEDSSGGQDRPKMTTKEGTFTKDPAPAPTDPHAGEEMATETHLLPRGSTHALLDKVRSETFDIFPT